MPHYIILFNFREQGIRNVKDTVKRSHAFKSAVEKVGGKFVSIYYTFGKYDIIATVEAPNDEVMMSVMLILGSLGNVSSETLKAFSIDEASNIIEKM